MDANAAVSHRANLRASCVAFGDQLRHRARAKLVDESLVSSGSDAVESDTPPLEKRKEQKARRARKKKHHRPTKLWMCDQGCCSIRWKLDYAEFQSYTKYAQVSPYIVVQDKSQRCACVICKGLPEKTLQQASDCSPEVSNPLKALLATYESHHHPHVDASALLQRVAMSPTSTPSPRVSEDSTTDDDDGSI